MPKVKISSAKSLWPPPLPSDESEQARLERIAAEEEAKRISDDIDRSLAAEKSLGPHAKILLLGQAESGKSTVLKNFQLNFCPKTFAAEAEVLWRPIIHLNLVRSVNFILNLLAGKSQDPSSHQPLYDSLPSDLRRICIGLAPLRQIEASLTKSLSSTSSVLSVPTYNPEKASEIAIRSSTGWKDFFIGQRRSENVSRYIERSEEAGRRILAACAEDMIKLWKNTSVHSWLKAHHVSLHEQPGFFLDDIARVTQIDYVPTSADILRARVTTIGPEKHHINLEKPRSEGGRDWVIYDIGGSRSQRAAWAQYFDDVNVVIFLAPLSGFNQVLAEDKSVNRMTDSLRLWKMICSNKLLASVELILFLNKFDVLDRKLRKDKVQFSRYVKSYTGANETNAVAEFLLDVFVTLHHENTPQKRKIHPHLTCAIDTKATSSVINRIHELVMMKILSENSIL